MKPLCYQIAELFSGAGGMALGAKSAKNEKAGFDIAWANDMDEDACKTFYRNLPIKPDRVICSKVQHLDFAQMGRIDGLAFGFPCNDFSVVGKRKGIKGEYGKLYQWGEKALRYFRPLFFVAENVGGLVSSGNNGDFDWILCKFKQAGYEVHPSLYRFEQYGVPQNRHRLIIVGFRKDLSVAFEHPAPTHLKTPVTAMDALADIAEDSCNHEYTRHQSRVIERLQHIKPGENAFTATLPARLKWRMNSGATITQMYRRLRPDQPAYTVTGSGGGGTHLYHWEEPRALTNRERARLQTFPDHFCFSGSRGSVRKQIGMAVPPLGAEIIFRAVLKSLVENEIRPEACRTSLYNSH